MSVFGPGTLDLTSGSTDGFTGGLRINNSTVIATDNNQLGKRHKRNHPHWWHPANQRHFCAWRCRTTRHHAGGWPGSNRRHLQRDRWHHDLSERQRQLEDHERHRFADQDRQRAPWLSPATPPTPTPVPPISMGALWTWLRRCRRFDQLHQRHHRRRRCHVRLQQLHRPHRGSHPQRHRHGIGSRAVLGGTGPINAAVTLDNLGDVLSPGNSPGIQTYTAAQSWSSFSYDWEVNDFTGTTAGSDFDQIDITGTLNLTGGSGSYILNVLGLTAGNVAGWSRTSAKSTAPGPSSPAPASPTSMPPTGRSTPPASPIRTPAPGRSPKPATTWCFSPTPSSPNPAPPCSAVSACSCCSAAAADFCSVGL